MYVSHLVHINIFLSRQSLPVRAILLIFLRSFTGTRKYTQEVYDACVASFRALPLSAVLDKRFLCVHGGISPELNTLSDILKVRKLLYLKQANEINC